MAIETDYERTFEGTGILPSNKCLINWIPLLYQVNLHADLSLGLKFRVSLNIGLCYIELHLLCCLAIRI